LNNAPQSLLSQLGQETALNNVGAAIYLKDRDGLYVYVNESVRRLFNLPLEDIIGKDDSVFFDLEASSELKDNDARVMDNAQVYEQEERNVVQSTGEERFYWTVKTPVFDDAGSVIGICGISTDITERRSAEQELRYLNVIVEQSSTIMYLALAVDGAPRIYTSGNVIRFGYTVEDCKGGKFRFPDFIHEDDRGRVLDGVELMLASGEDLLESEYRLIAADGRVCHVLDRTLAIRDEAGSVTHWQGAITDVTDRWEAEQAMKRSEALLAAQADELASAREEVKKLRVEINQARRQDAVAEIVESEDFARLAEKAAELRARNSET
jgi:PAS domain S-box-containing protein